MAATRQDFDLKASTAKIVYFGLTNNGAPLDLSTAVLRWRMADQIDAANATVEKTSAASGGIVITDPGGGLCNITIADSDVVESGLYYHYLDANFASGGWECLAKGRVVVSPSVGAAA